MKKMLSRRNLAFLLYYSGILHLGGFLSKHLYKNIPLFLEGHRVLEQPLTNSETRAINELALCSGHAITAKELEKRLSFVMKLRPPGDPRDFATGLPKTNAFYISFDDGYLDNLLIAGPILRKLNLKAIIFPLGDTLIDPYLLPWWDSIKNGADIQPSIEYYAQSCKEKKISSRGLSRDNPKWTDHLHENCLYLAINDAKLLHEDGCFFLGSHTLSHPNLTLLDDNELAIEINGGIDLLKEFKNYLPVFAYPFGLTNDHIQSFIKKNTNIILAFATGMGENNAPYNIKRVNINTSPFCLFVAECLGIFEYFKIITNFISKTVLTRKNK